MGLPDKKDWTWSKFKDLYEDLEDMEVTFLKIWKAKRTVSAAAASIGLSLIWSTRDWSRGTVVIL